jgi:hypothetical protein
VRTFLYKKSHHAAGPEPPDSPASGQPSAQGCATRQTINLVSRLKGAAIYKLDHLDQTKDLAPAGPHQTGKIPAMKPAVKKIE